MATAAGSRPTLSAPFDGERRLISAMTASSGVAVESARGTRGSARIPPEPLDELVERPLVGRRHLAMAGDDAVEVGGQVRAPCRRPA